MTTTPPAAGARRDSARIILRHLYENRHATKRDLQRTLGLSLPTIGARLRELEDDGLIACDGHAASTGGRKAHTYAFDAASHVAIGVAMHPTELNVYAVDLYGTPVAHVDRTTVHRNDNAYYQRVGALVDEIAAEREREGSTVLGVAFAVPGIVAPDGESIAFDPLMGDTGLTLATLAQNVHHPTTMIHAADADATAELWFDRTLRDAVCLYLNRRVGGALVIGGRLHQGPNRCNGAIEHMTLTPGGRACYCGRRGCVDAYCSPETLPEDYESIPGFFSVLEQGETHHRARMNEWLDHIAQAIVNARTVVAGDVIVGGEAAQYLVDEDIAALRARIEARMPYGLDRFTLRKWLGLDGQDAIGAALTVIGPYLHALFGD